MASLSPPRRIAAAVTTAVSVTLAVSLTPAVSAGTELCRCPGDSNGDLAIDFDDVVSVLANWGSCGPACPPACAADFDDTCEVDFADLLIVLSQWGDCDLDLPDAGPTLPQAHDLGPVDAVLLQTCGTYTTGDIDVYRFELSAPRRVNVNLTGRADGGSLRLVADGDGDEFIDPGDELAVDWSTGNGALSIAQDLDTGAYWLIVNGWNADDTTLYTLSVSADEAIQTTPASDPPDDYFTAYALGTITDTPIEAREMIGPYDVTDIYGFDVTEPRRVDVLVTDRHDGGQVTLIADVNDNGAADPGEALANDWSTGSGTLSLTQDLDIGAYLLVVTHWNTNDSTRYTLRVTSPETIEITSVTDPGSSMLDPYDLGVMNGTVIQEREIVGPWDEEDVYRFDIVEPRRVDVLLTDRRDGGQVTLVADVNGNGAIDAGELLANDWSTGSGMLSFGQDLGPGTYRIIVEDWNANDSTRYTLRLTSPGPIEITPSSDPGDGLLTAYDLGTVTTEIVQAKDLYGPFDLADVYAFSVDTVTTINVLMTDRLDGGRLRLIDDVNGNGAVDSGEELANDWSTGSGTLSLQRTLDPGTYFIIATYWNANDSTRYTLRLTPQP